MGAESTVGGTQSVPGRENDAQNKKVTVEEMMGHGQIPCVTEQRPNSFPERLD